MDRDSIIIKPPTCRRVTKALSLITLLSLSLLNSKSSLQWVFLSSTPTCTCKDATTTSSNSSGTSKVKADVDVVASDDANARSVKPSRKVSRKDKLLPLVEEVQDEKEEDEEKQVDLLVSSHGVKPRAFPLWQNGTRELPCREPEEKWWRGYVQRSHTTSGILFIKPPKTGSSTAAGVTLRIASRLGAKRNVTPLCKNRVQHAKAHTMRYHKRRRRHSILWSIVREPTSRTVSQFFHMHVSRRRINATDEIFQKYLEDREDMLTDFQIKYLSFKNYENTKTIQNPIREINEILQKYDFIGVSERMEESIVALQMILGLETADVMYLSVKGSGSFDDGKYEDRCTFIQKSHLSPYMKSYFASEKWQNIVRSDQLFHQTVNRSLDLTIEQLGRTKFQENLHKLRVMRKEMDQLCLPKVRLPCNQPSVQDGDPPRTTTDCLFDDLGCGFKCMDRLLAGMQEKHEESTNKKQ